MRLRIDQQSDALYLDLTGREIDSSEEVSDGIIGSVPNLLLIELFLKQIKWLEAHTNIVETLPASSTMTRMGTW